MQVPAIYIVPDGSATVPCLIRVHTKYDALGDVKGTSFSYAERNEEVPRIICRKDQIDPLRLGIFSVEPGEAYCVDNSNPPDDEFITSEVTRVPLEDTVGLPVPDCYDDTYEGVLDPAIFSRRSSIPNYIQSNFPTMEVSPVDLQAGDDYNFPLTSSSPIVDERQGLYASHVFFDADRFYPYAVDDQYFIRIDLDVISLTMSNNATFEIDIDGTQDEILQMTQPIPRSTTGQKTRVSFFTRVYAKQTFLDNGGQFRVRFENDAQIVGTELYVSV